MVADYLCGLHDHPDKAPEGTASAGAAGATGHHATDEPYGN